MKKLFLPILFCLFSTAFNVKASHLMGGQITVQHLSTDSTILKLTLYRDTLGISLDTAYETYNIYTDSTCLTLLGTGYFNYNGFSNIGNGVEEYNFSKTFSSADSIYLADSAATDYYITWTSCCRNAAISNLSTPANESMFLQTHYHTFGPGFVNSTPVFLNQPVTTCQINQPWQYNPLPYDADADSLHWYIDVPWNSNLVPCAGYTIPLGLATDPFVINATTGQITWTPIALGNWNATVMVDEYRNGQKIGFIRRDMQILVLDSTAFGTGSSPMVTMNGNAVQTQQQFKMSIPANQAFSLLTNATDVDNNDLKFTLQGEPFILNNNPASTIIQNGTGNATATLNWTPQTSQIREAPYNSTIRMYEKNANSVYVKMYDITVQLQVIATPAGVSNTNLANNNVQISPNPAMDFTIVQFTNTKNENATIIISDMKGRTIKNYTPKSFIGTNTQLISTHDMPNGLYNIAVYTNNFKAIGKIVVQH